MERFTKAVAALNEVRELLRNDEQEEWAISHRVEIGRLLDECKLLILSKGRSESASRSGPPSPHGQDSVQRRAAQTRGREAKDVNVLVVDDDEVTAMGLSKQLTKLQIQNEYVLSGQRALERLYESPDLFQLVLCDVNMPGLDGGEVLCRILSDPRLRYIPIVMVSSDTDLSKARELVQAGAKDYILKPVRQISLVSLTYKVHAWQQVHSTRHLSAIYEISSALLLHLKVILSSRGGEEGAPPLPGPIRPAASAAAASAASAESPNAQARVAAVVAADDEVVENTVLRAIVQAASPPMRQLLGVTENEIALGSVDVLNFVLPEDKAVLATQMKHAIFLDEEEAVEARDHKLVWRWIDSNGNSVPVVGQWSRIGDSGECELLLESSSLLPSLLLKRETERRKFAEREAEEARMQTSRLEEDLRITRKSDMSMRDELTSMMCEMSEFSKMVTENPRVLTWRIRVRDGLIDFVSAKSSLAVLGFESKELVGKSNKELLFPDDADKAQTSLTTINQTVRLRRFNKQGEVVWLESRAYAWWDQDQTTVVVTEYDITKLLGAQGPGGLESAS